MAWATRSRKTSGGAGVQLCSQCKASSSTYERARRSASWRARVDLPELVLPTITMRWPTSVEERVLSAIAPKSISTLIEGEQIGSPQLAVPRDLDGVGAACQSAELKPVIAV